MPNALSYIKNVGKSVTYATIDVAKEMNPVFNDFAETNGEISKDIYKSVKNLKKTIRTTAIKVMSSQYGQFAKTFKDNLFSDLKTGKFYNRERIEQYEEKAAMAMMGGGFDDFDFGGDDGGDDWNFDSDTSFDDEPSTNEMIDIVGEKASNAISNTMAKSAEYIVESNTQMNKVMYNQMNAMYGGIYSGLSTINQNISKIIEFSIDTVVTHFENSRTFYSEISRLDQERNQYLKDISETLKQMNSPIKKDEYKTTGYSDLVTYEGNLDISRYFENVKKNIKNNSGGMFDMLSMMVETGMLETLASSPISGAVTAVVKGVLPSILEDSMEKFNKTLSGLVGNAFMKLKEKAKKEGGTWDTISEIFGINTNLKTNIDVKNYEKGKVPFDGITRKAIIEVIPTYLSKILSAVSGRKEDRFDYENGKFVTVDKLREEFEGITSSSANMAAYGLNDIINRKKNSLSFRDDNERKQFEDDWEAMKLYMFKNQVDFNTRKNLKGENFGLKGGAADINVKVIQQLLDGSPEIVKYADNIFREVENQNRRMRQLEEYGNAGALFNNSSSNDDSISGIHSILSNSNNSIVSELVAIHKELSYIRTYGTGSSGKGKGKKGKNKTGRPDFNAFDIKSSDNLVNDDTYDKQQSENVEEHIENLTEEEISERVRKIVDGTKEEDNKEKTPSKTFSEKMHEASGLSAKIHVLTQSATELAKKPAKFLVAMMDKADNRLYDLIYGPKEDKEGKKSFIGRLFNNLEKMFNKFSDFVTESIIEPLKDKFTKENAHEAAKKFFGIFGIDLDKSVASVKEFLFGKKDEAGERTKNGLFGKVIDGFEKFSDGVKSEFKSAFGWVKNTFKDFGEWTGITGKQLNKKGRAKQEHNSTIDNQLSMLSKIMNPETVDNTPELATGMRRVNKTGLAILSEGEMVIPPDMNPFNISKRKRNERAVKNNLKKSIDNIYEYAEGTTDAASGEPLSDEEQEELAMEAAQAARNLRAKKQEITDEDYGTYGQRVGEEIIDALTMTRDGIRNMNESLGLNNENTDKFKKNAMTFIEKVKDHGTTMAAGAGIGAGVSVLTGLIGGPLVGAAVGAGVGLIAKSEKIQEMLFGELKDGKRQGGLISKDISNNINKYFPDMGKGATIGGILTALPFVPGGPVAGVILGSALGFAKNNDNVQNALFGEDKFLGTKEQFQNKVQKVLPKMGAGALAGLLAGPFGLTTNVILGSALGFAADTNKFKDLMFGKEEDGKREGGIFGAVTKPMAEFFKKTYEDFREFIKKDIMQPVANAIAPIKKQFEIMGEYIKDAINNMFYKTIGAPLERFLKEKVIDPMGGLFSKLFKAISTPIKFIVSSPFKMVGKVGDALRKHQIKTGQADYMGAEQRNAFRRSKGWKMRIGDPRDRYGEFDQSLENMDLEALNAAQIAMAGIKDTNKNLRATENESFKRVRKAFDEDKNINLDIRKTALQILKDGGYERAQKYIRESNINEESKNKILQILVKESAKMKYTKKMKENSEETINKVASELQSLGFKISPDMLKRLSKGDKEAKKIYNMLVGEQNYREKNKVQTQATQGSTSDQEDKLHDVIKDSVTEFNKNQDKRHTEVANTLKNIQELLADLNNKTDIYSTINQEPLQRQEARNRVISGTSENIEEDIANARGSKGDDFSLKRMYHSTKRGVGKITKGTLKFAATTPFKAIGKGYNLAKSGYSKLRNTKFFNTMWGDRNTDWQNTIRGIPTVVSEDEIIANVDNIEERATGGFVGDGGNKPNFFIKSIQNIEKFISKLTGIAMASAYKDGLNVDSIKDDSKSVDSYFGKIKTKFKKIKAAEYQFVNGRPYKLIRDKNGDLNPDPSSAENNEVEKEIQEAEDREKGILDSLKEMPTKLGDLFGKFFGNKDDEDEESWISKLLDKIPTSLKTAAAATAGVAALGLASDTVIPIIKDAWNTTIGPYLNEAWAGNKDGFGKFIYFFNPENPEGLVPKIKTFMTEEFPKLMEDGAAVISEVVSFTIKNVLPGVVSGIIKTLPDILKGTVSGTISGVNELLGGEEGGETVQENLGQAGLRAVGRGLTGTSTGIKGASRVIKAGSKTLSTATRFIPFVGKKTSSVIDTAGNLVSKAPEKLNKVAQTVGNTISGGKLNKVIESTEEVFKTASKGATEGTEAAAKSGALKKIANKVGSKLKEFIVKAVEAIKGFFKNSKIFDSISDAIKPYLKKGKAGKNFIKTGVDKFGDFLAKSLPDLLEKHGKKSMAKAATKLGVYTVSGAILLIADAVVSFGSGYKNANSILGITEEPNALVKVLCGIMEAFNSVFCLGLVPLNIIVDLIVEGSKLLGVDIFSALDAQRQAAKEEVDAYNAEHGTDYTIEEYNKKDRFFTKIGNKVKGAGKWIAGKAGDAKDWVVDTAGNVVDGVKGAGKWIANKASDAKDWVVDTGKSIGNKVKGAGKWIAGKAGDAKDWVVDKAKGVKDKVSTTANDVFDAIHEKIDVFKDIGSYVGDVFKDTWKELVSGKEQTSKKLKIEDDDPNASIKKIIYDTIKILAFVPSNIVKIGRKVWDGGIKPFVDGIVKVGKGVGTTAKSLFTKAWNGDIIGAFTDTSGNVNSNNKGLDILSKVINYLVKIPLAIPGLITSGVGLIVNNFDSVVDGFKSIGSGVGTTVKNLFNKAWEGNVIEAFTDTSGNTNSGNRLIDTVSKALNTTIKIPLAIPGLISSGVGVVVRSIDPIISGLKSIGSGVTTTVDTLFNKAWEGNVIEAFTDTSGNTDTGNGFVDTVSKVLNGVIKIPLAIPGLITSGVGLIVNNFDSIIDGFKTIGEGVVETTETLFEKAWEGDIIGAFTDTSGDADTGNSLVDTVSKVINTTIKIPLAIPGLLTSGVGLVVDGITSVIDGFKTIGSGISDTVSTVMKTATEGKNPLKNIFSIDTNTSTGNLLVDGTSALVNGLIKIPLTPIALLTSGFNFVKNNIDDLINGISKAGDLAYGDKDVIEKANEGDLSPLSRDYWKNHNNLTGLPGVLNSFVTFINKVFNLPAALVANIKPLNLLEKGLDWIAKKLGIDDSETSGSGSGIAGRGSGLYVGRGTNYTDESSNNSFISQVDSKYKNQSFNISADTQKQTIGDTGCAPAAAAMAINSTTGMNNVSMEDASKLALKYKVKNDGVNATYFNEEFARNGMTANYITSQNSNERNQEIVRNLSNNNKVILMGKDSTNTSKADSPFGPNSHYVVANRLSNDGKYIYINDPEAKTPNIRYKTSKILGSSKLGIAANIASGSKINSISKASRKFKKYVGRATYGPDTVQYRVWVRLRGAGFSEEATAGAMGNIEAESGFQTNNLENAYEGSIGYDDVSYTNALDSGKISKEEFMYPLPNKGKCGYGLCQWTWPSRKAGLYDYAKEKGVSISDVDMQIDYLIGECQNKDGGCNGHAYKILGNYSNGYTQDMFFNAKTPEEACKVFYYAFEGPPATDTSLTKRTDAADMYYEIFKGTPGVTGSSGDTILASSTSNTDTTDITNSSSQNNSVIGKIYNVFNDLAAAYGITGNTTSSSINGSYPDSEGTVSSNASIAEKQKAVVDKARSITGTIQYSMTGPRDPEQGSADCSSFVNWAYKKTVGKDIGGYTGAQTSNSNLYRIDEGTGGEEATPDESKLQLGDLLYYTRDYSSKDPTTYPMGIGHVGMYMGDGKEIHHPGGGGLGPKELALKDATRFRLAMRLKDFNTDNDELSVSNGKGSGIPLQYKPKFKDEARAVTYMQRKLKNANKQSASRKVAYNNALKHISNKEIKSLLPIGYDQKEISEKNISVMRYNSDNDLVAADKLQSGKLIYNGRGTQGNNTIVYTKDTTSKPSDSNSNMIELIKSILKLLVQIVTNTDQLNNIAKLLGEYISAMNSSDGSEQSKQTAILAKQNLINAMQSGSGNSSNAQLMKLIEATEKIARE